MSGSNARGAAFFAGPGELHLGNDLGASREPVASQEAHRCLFCVVDVPAFTPLHEGVRDNLDRIPARRAERLKASEAIAKTLDHGAGQAGAAARATLAHLPATMNFTGPVA